MTTRRRGVFVNCVDVRLYYTLVLSSVLVNSSPVRVIVMVGLSRLFESRNAVYLYTMLVLSRVFAAMFAGVRRLVILTARAERFSPDLLD
jgi:hypothetical protein